MAKPANRTRQATPTQELLTPRQAAEVYGIPERSLYDLVTRGVLPVVRIPTTKRLWYRRSDLQTLIASSTSKNAA